jgi:acyl-coenzyme A synthetase/AMP-(fatty) acid ligase
MGQVAPRFRVNCLENHGIHEKKTRTALEKISERLESPTFFNFALDVLDVHARTRPDAPALWHVNAVTGREQKFSFAEISHRSKKAAGMLLAAGVKPEDRVLLMLPRVPEWWICMLALVRVGAIPVPATLLLTPRDVAYRVQAARVTTAITNAEGLPKLRGFEGLRIVVGAEGESTEFCLEFDKATAKAQPYEGLKTRGNDPGILYFTSATTGDPKMVMHTQASYGLGHRLTGGLWLDLGPEDIHWNISDLGWGKAAWSSFYGPWQMGSCVFALDVPGRFDPSLTLDTLENYPITSWCAPPTALRLIVRENFAARCFPKLRHCVTAGEPLNPEVLSLWKNATGLTLYEGYGQSETVILIANFRSLGLPVRPGSMGIPTPGMDLCLLDEDLQEVGPDAEGEIALRVRPHRPIGLFKEYWLSPEEMDRAFVRDFYLTGDKAVREADGYFWFIGRKDDVIKSSGYRIGPFEVESALLEHPAVLDVAVVGKPDPLRGQIVKAFVVLRPGTATERDLKTELQVHCKNLIAAFKYPREIEFVGELPKTTSGKTRRVDLRNSQKALTV